MHRAAYRLATVGSLLAGIASLYLAAELWLDASTQRVWASGVSFVLAVVSLCGLGTALMIWRFAVRAVGLLLVFAIASALVPRPWGIPAASFFLLAAILNVLGSRRDPLSD